MASTTSAALLVDKPAGLTSHDVVARVRRLLGERRVGHAGTLDPMATGLLVLGVGSATRLLRFAQGGTKRYVGEVQLGVATDSLDAQGAEVARAAVPDLDERAVRDTAAAMTGDSLQVPPMVSAVHHGGRRLYELAREGRSVERDPRPITVTSFRIESTPDPTRWTFDVVCSAGTYVRVLASDLAERLGTVGHLARLRRVASGTTSVHDAVSLEDLETDARGALRPARILVDALAQVTLGAEDVARVRHGQRVSLSVDADEVAALDAAGEVVGVLTRRAGTFQPTLVLPGAA